MAPGLRPRLETLVQQGRSDLHRRDADIAVRFVAPSQPNLIARRVGEVSLGLYASQCYLHRCGKPHVLDDLKGHVLIGTRDGQEIRRVAERLGFTAHLPAMPFRSDDVLVRHSMVCAGLGIGACHHWLAAADPDLERVLPDVEALRLPVWLVAHEDLHRSRSLRLVFDGLHEELATLFAA